MTILVSNVTALWPRINRTYKFDANENKSVPCDAQDPLAAYELSFEMTKDSARALWDSMCEAYNAKKQAGWPDKPVNPFKQTDEGTFIGKAKLKGNYNGELTKKPLQVDASNKKLGDDFMLTTGSKINLAVTPVPYNMREAGVSLRLSAVQVVEYKPMEETNPFGEVKGFSAPASDPFGLPEVKAAPAGGLSDLDDEIPFAPEWRI